MKITEQRVQRFEWRVGYFVLWVVVPFVTSYCLTSSVIA